jgi:hypothetical protein
MIYHPDDVNSWLVFKPLIIAHDVGRSRDRSTAVVGGNSPYGSRLLGVHSAEELPQNLFGTSRANALATVDARYHRNGLIVADLSNDASYAEVLVATFGQRVIGVHISRFGDGMSREIRALSQGWIPVYHVGRTYLLELLHGEFQAGLVRCVDSPEMRRIYEQLVHLNVELRQSGTVYSCPPGKHDDLGISCAMLAWAARHPHLGAWVRNFEMARRPRTHVAKRSWAGWT